MSQAYRLRGLRGLGAGMGGDQGTAAGAKPLASVGDTLSSAWDSLFGGGPSGASSGGSGGSSPMAAAKAAAGGGGGGGGGDGGGATILNMPAITPRAPRPSALNQSWSFPLQLQPIESRTRGPSGVSGMTVGLIAAGVLIGGAILYMIAKD